MAHISSGNPFLDWLAEQQELKQASVRSYRRYYEGDHPTFLTARQLEFLNLERDKNFALNVCGVVIDTTAERLGVTGFSVQQAEDAVDVTPEEDEDELTDEQSAENLLSSWWQQNRMDARQSHVHRAALREAESFIIVEWDQENNRPKFSHDFAFDGEEGVKVHLKPGTHSDVWFASKRWIISMGKLAGKVARLNLYFPNRIEKYINTSFDGKNKEAFWQPLPPDTEEGLQLVEITEDGRTYTATVAWWTDSGAEAGNPLGVPVIPFINRDNGAGVGQSELDNAIPIQDAINKAYLDQIAAGDMTGWQMYWHSGAVPTGGWKVYPGAIFDVEPANEGDPVGMGVLPAGDLGQLIAYQSWQIKMLAGITGTPQTRFSPAAVRPSEETQKQEEAALVAKVEGIHQVWGNSWEDVMGMGVKLVRAFGNEIKFPEDVIISAQWKDAQVRNEKEHAEAVAIKREKLDISKRQAWRELEYSADDIERMEEENEKARMERIEEQTLQNQTRNADSLATLGRAQVALGNGRQAQELATPGAMGQRGPEPIPAPNRI